MLTINQALQQAVVHHNSNRFSEAEVLYRQILKQLPSQPKVLHLLGVLLTATDRFPEAVSTLQAALKHSNNDAHIAGDLGITLCHLEQYDQAITLLTDATIRSPSADFYAALANALLHRDHLDSALAAAQQALDLDPAHSHAKHTLAQIHNNLGNLFKDQACLDDAIAHYRQAIALAPDIPQYHSNLLFALHFHPQLTQEEIANEHRLFNERHAILLKSPDHQITRSPKLKIGYIGMQFVAGYHLLSLIANHDRSRFEIFIYSNTPKPDAQTDEFRRHADHFMGTRHLTDEQLVDKIRNDQIDILVDTSLHMGNNRALVFARKPAPIQISFFGYPAPTGLTAIDYRITDRHLEPLLENSKLETRNSKESQKSNVQNGPQTFERELSNFEHSGGGNLEFDSNFEFRTSNFERPLCLPDTYWCYHPHVKLPINPLPAVSNGYITFGNLNNFCKINEPTLELWAKILSQVPRSRLIMMSHEGSHRDRIRHFFQQRNITPDRIEFVCFLPPEQYFATYHRIDIGLDSFPYNGHTTSLDAFYMGVPVTTIIGTTPVSRATYSQLTNLNLLAPPTLAATTPDDFVQITTTLVNDLPRLAALRATLRQRMAASPLMDASRYARNVEELYTISWKLNHNATA